MPYCGPAYAIPSCASSPVVGFGSAGLGLGCGGLGYSGLGAGAGGIVYGAGSGGLATTSRELGTLAGIIPQPINQVPPAEVVIQPAPFVVTIPGPILSATPEPVYVGGITPCAVGGSGLGGGLSEALGYGMRNKGLLGRRSLVGHRGSICLTPC